MLDEVVLGTLKKYKKELVVAGEYLIIDQGNYQRDLIFTSLEEVPIFLITTQQNSFIILQWHSCCVVFSLHYVYYSVDRVTITCHFPSCLLL